MCIILVKPAGEGIPDYSLIEKCFKANPDGAGIMFRDCNHVHIDKGFMSPHPLMEYLDTLEDDDEISARDVVIHFRLSTHGGISPECTHPFPISHSIDDLTSLSINCDAAIAHNGILYQYAPKKGTGISDTMIFVSEMARNGIDEKKHFMVKNGMGQKFTLMTIDHLFIYGDFIYDQGFYFSNSSYL
jgi:predicted glutamine amidotransferase